MTLIALKLTALALVALALAVPTFLLARVPAAEAPTLGPRGAKRRATIGEGGLFAAIEPLVRKVAGWMARLPLSRLRLKVDAELKQAGDYMGISPDEYIAMSVMAAFGFGLAGVLLSSLLEMSFVMVIPAAAFGLASIHMQVDGDRKRRFKEVTRSLPAQIDLAAMCMGAGLDLPSALRLIVGESAGSHATVREELSRILQELELGHTRKQAFRAFEQRVPSESVREFCGAVVQAEEKGTPLAEVLRIQAGMLRMRRSVMAEEAAAKAGTMMMIPLVLLLGCMMLSLMGALGLSSSEAGF